MGGFWEKFKHHFVPSKANAYKPHLLGKSWLVFFLAAVMAVEGFLVADLAAQQSGQVFLASVASVAPAAPGQIETQRGLHDFTQSFERQFIRVLEEPRAPANSALGALGAFVAVLVMIAFVVRIEIQPMAMLASGALVAVLAFSFVYLNYQFLGAGINNLHQSQASVTLSL